jgi:hypothetical protein
VPGHGLSMLAGEAREGGGIVEVLLDGELLGDGADGSHGKQTQRYESEMIVRTKRCVSLPGAAGYGCMVGLAIASGRETIAVGALSSGIAGITHNAYIQAFIHSCKHACILHTHVSRISWQVSRWPLTALSCAQSLAISIRVGLGASL